MIIIKRPILTEKSMKLAASGLYAFEVDKEATKNTIAKIVSDKFKVKVLSVKIINVKGQTKSQKRVRKSYMTSGFKKALVQVKKGEKIAIFETPKEDKEAISDAVKRAGLRRDYILEEFCVSTSCHSSAKKQLLRPLDRILRGTRNCLPGGERFRLGHCRPTARDGCVSLAMDAQFPGGRANRASGYPDSGGNGPNGVSELGDVLAL